MAASTRSGIERFIPNASCMLFREFQIAEHRNDMVSLKAIMDGFYTPNFGALGEAYCRRVNAPDGLVMELYSYGELVAMIYAKQGIVEIKVDKISTSTDRHIRAFLFAATGRDFDLSAIRKLSYAEAKELGMLLKSSLTPCNCPAVRFPIVTVGMLNRALKVNGNAEIKVGRKANKYMVYRGYNGGCSTLCASNTLKGCTEWMISNKLISVDQLVMYNNIAKNG